MGEEERRKKHTAVNLSCSNHDHDNIDPRVLLGNVVAHPASHGADDEDGEELETDDAL